MKFSNLLGKRIFFIHDLHQQYGPIVRVGPNEVACSSPEAFKEINKVPSFPKSDWYFRQSDQGGRHGLFTMPDNRSHQRRRKMLSKGFGQTFLRENWEARLKVQVERAIKRIEQDAKNSVDGEVDCLKWWTFMTSDISALLFFGEPFGMLNTGEVRSAAIPHPLELFLKLYQESEFIKVVTRILQGGVIRADFPWVYQVLKRIPLEAFKRVFQSLPYLHEFATPAVTASKKEGDKANLFATMFANAEKGDEQLDDLDVKVEATNLIVAGTDTTAVTLTYLQWAVLQRPALRKSVEDEVDGLPQSFRDADVEKLPLLGAVIEETLRLYGAAPGPLPRTVPNGGTNLGGSPYFLPEGTIVACQSYSLHRDPTLFPDPEK